MKTASKKTPCGIFDLDNQQLLLDLQFWYIFMRPAAIYSCSRSLQVDVKTPVMLIPFLSLNVSVELKQYLQVSKFWVMSSSLNTTMQVPRENWLEMKGLKTMWWKPIVCLGVLRVALVKMSWYSGKKKGFLVYNPRNSFLITLRCLLSRVNARDSMNLGDLPNLRTKFCLDCSGNNVAEVNYFDLYLS